MKIYLKSFASIVKLFNTQRFPYKILKKSLKSINSPTLLTLYPTLSRWVLRSNYPTLSRIQVPIPALVHIEHFILFYHKQSHQKVLQLDDNSLQHTDPPVRSHSHTAKTATTYSSLPCDCEYIKNVVSKMLTNSHSDVS